MLLKTFDAPNILLNPGPCIFNVIFENLYSIILLFGIIKLKNIIIIIYILFYINHISFIIINIFVIFLSIYFISFIIQILS